MTGNKIKARTQTYSAFCREFGVKNPSYIYIDAEGYDHVIFKQAIIHGHKPLLLSFECNELTSPLDGDRIIEFLQGYGYKVFHLGGVQCRLLYPYASCDLMAISSAAIEFINQNCLTPLSPCFVEEVRTMLRQEDLTFGYSSSFFHFRQELKHRIKRLLRIF